MSAVRIAYDVIDGAPTVVMPLSVGGYLVHCRVCDLDSIEETHSHAMDLAEGHVSLSRLPGVACMAWMGAYARHEARELAQTLRSGGES